MDLPGLLLPLLLKVVQAVAMPLAMQLNMIALRLHDKRHPKLEKLRAGNPNR